MRWRHQQPTVLSRHPQVAFADAAAMPAQLRVSHAPALHCTLKPLDQVDLMAAAAGQLQCQVLLGRGSYVQRFLKLEFEGSPGPGTGVFRPRIAGAFA